MANELLNAVKPLLDKHSVLSLRQIIKATGFAEGGIRRRLDQLVDRGDIHRATGFLSHSGAGVRRGVFYAATPQQLELCVTSNGSGAAEDWVLNYLDTCVQGASLSMMLNNTHFSHAILRAAVADLIDQRLIERKEGGRNSRFYRTEESLSQLFAQGRIGDTPRGANVQI